MSPAELEALVVELSVADLAFTTKCNFDVTWELKTKAERDELTELNNRKYAVVEKLVKAGDAILIAREAAKGVAA